jgi:hypothetical protein
MAHKETFVTRSGELITDDIADELALEAEAGYDIDELAKVRPGPGRKSLAGGAGKSPAINLRLAPDTYQRLTPAAANAGETISDIVRDAIDRQLRRLERTSRR